MVVFLDTNIMFVDYTLHTLSSRLCIPDLKVLKNKTTLTAVDTLRMSQRKEREIDSSCNRPIIIISIKMLHVDAVATARRLVCLQSSVVISELVCARWPEEI
jgi:hypothetical protein